MSDSRTIAGLGPGQSLPETDDPVRELARRACNLVRALATASAQRRPMTAAEAEELFAVFRLERQLAGQSDEFLAAPELFDSSK